MAESIVIQLDLQTGNTKTAFKGIESQAKKSGLKSGKNFSNAFSSSLKGLAKTTAKIGALVGSIASALTFRASIRAAQEQEDAINQLNSALQISGKFSEQASRDLQNYASSLQQVTRFGDETILRTQGLIQSLGNLSKNQLKEATRATLDLAAALKIDLNTAALLVGKAAAGEVGTFSRYGLSIKKAEDNTKTFANALTAIQQKFGGAAQKDVLTFSGATQQLSNTFGDLLEEVGFLITRQPIVLQGIKSLNGVFQDAIKTVNSFRKNFNIFDDLIKPLFRFNQSVIDYAIKPLELLTNIGKIVFVSLGSGIAQVIAAFAKLGGVVGSILNAVGIENKLTDQLNQFSNGALLNAGEKAEQVRKAIASIGDTSFSDNLAERNNDLRNYFAEQQAIIAENASSASNVQTQQAEVAKTSLLGLGSVFSTVFSGINTTIDNSSKKIQQVNERVKKFSAEAANSLRQGLATGAGQAFKEFGKALVTGENALKAFTDSLLKTIADQAVALGTKFILEGAAYAFLPGYQALSGPLIAAGAALAAFGGALGATIGGGDSGGGSGGGSPTTQDTNQFLVEETTAPQELERQQPQTNVEVVVQGSLVQQEELGTFIAETLSESFGKQGVSLTDARLA